MQINSGDDDDEVAAHVREMMGCLQLVVPTAPTCIHGRLLESNDPVLTTYDLNFIVYSVWSNNCICGLLIDFSSRVEKRISQS